MISRNVVDRQVMAGIVTVTGGRGRRWPLDFQSDSDCNFRRMQ